VIELMKALKEMKEILSDLKKVYRNTSEIMYALSDAVPESVLKSALIQLKYIFGSTEDALDDIIDRLDIIIRILREGEKNGKSE